MESFDRKKHWDTIYRTKNPSEVSWTQQFPKTSLDFIRSLSLPKSAAIIDIGGGESRLAECLLAEGYTDITVLDISKSALDKTKKRLGGDAERIQWIVSDITDFQPDREYALWHDRAAFHFLTAENEISKYLDTAIKYISGYLVLGTFSTEGPSKCSGLDIIRYDKKSLTKILDKGFKKLKCITADHRTPFDTIQNFLFCSFKRK